MSGYDDHESIIQQNLLRQKMNEEMSAMRQEIARQDLIRKQNKQAKQIEKMRQQMALSETNNSLENNIMNSTSQVRSAATSTTETNEEENEEFQDADETQIFNSYYPVKLKEGNPHPDPLVQSASMSAVEPPNITYKHHLPKSLIEKTLISAPQLESVVYACQIHESENLPGNIRRGFFLGDGAGVGKGRQLSALILENWLQGRKKHIWLSAHADLLFDARRDLGDIEAAFVSVNPLNKMTYAPITIDEGVIFSTYSSLTACSSSGKRTSRLSQLVDFCGGEDFDGLILFDECHRAKNLVCTKGKPSKTGKAVFELQIALPRARIVYCSATGVTEPTNLAYMIRLGLWGPGSPFPEGFDDFRIACERSGIGMMELVSMHLKRQGLYICRTLSFEGCLFHTVTDAITERQTRLYDRCCRLWQLLFEALIKGFAEGSLKYPLKPPKKKVGEEDDYDEEAIMFEEDEEDDDVDKDERPMRMPFEDGVRKMTALRYFWVSHQRFFRALNISLKVPHAISVAKQSLSEGRSVVIGLQSTGEASVEGAMRKAEKGDANGVKEYVSSPHASLKRVIYKLFPLPPQNGAVTFQPMAPSKRQTRNTKYDDYSGSESESEWDSEDEEDEEDRAFIASSDEDENNENSGSDDDEFKDKEIQDIDEIEEIGGGGRRSPRNRRGNNQNKEVTFPSLSQQKRRKMARDGWIFNKLYSKDAMVGQKIRRFFPGYPAHDGLIVAFLEEVKENFSEVKEDNNNNNIENEGRISPDLFEKNELTGTQSGKNSNSGKGSRNSKKENEEEWKGKLWRIMYSDGDQEDLEEEELRLGIYAFKQKRNSPPSQKERKALLKILLSKEVYDEEEKKWKEENENNKESIVIESKKRLLKISNSSRNTIESDEEFNENDCNAESEIQSSKKGRISNSTDEDVLNFDNNDNKSDGSIELVLSPLKNMENVVGKNENTDEKKKRKTRILIDSDDEKEKSDRQESSEDIVMNKTENEREKTEKVNEENKS